MSDTKPIKAGRRTTVNAMMRIIKNKNATCASCKGYPWECKCLRTARDLVEWMVQVSRDLERSVEDLA